MVLKRTLPSRVPQAGGAAASPSAAPVSAAGADFEAPLPKSASAPVTPSQPSPPPHTQPEPAPKVDTAAALAAALAELAAQAQVPASQVQVPVDIVPPQVAHSQPAVDEPEQGGGDEEMAGADRPSTPDNNSMRRRVRDKKPRAFTSAPPVVPMQAPSSPGVSGDYASTVAAQLEDKLASMGVADTAHVQSTSFGVPEVSAVSDADYLAPPSEPISLERETESFVAESSPTPPSVAAPSQSPSNEAPGASSVQAEIPPIESDLPWAKPSELSNDWEFDAPAASAPAPQPAPPQDIFRSVVADAPLAETAVGVVPPWQLARSPSLPPPELPLPRKPSFTTSGNGSSMQVVVAGAVVALILFGAYKMVQSDKPQEQVARWTGSLQEATEKLPPEMGGVQPQPDADLIKPEQVIAMQDGLSSNTLLPPPAGVGQSPMEDVFAGHTSTSSSAVIDFADVPPDESGKPIMADGTEKMPEDIGFIASLQKAIATEKAKKGLMDDTTAPDNATTKAPEAMTQVERIEHGEEMKAKLEEELAAYRRALAGADNPALAPKPTEFFSGEGKKADASLLPPPAKGAESVAALTGKANGLPPAELYTNNPANLPVIPEPTAEEEVKIRELKDFDVELFEPEREKVRIPKGIKPRFATTDFPDLEVLSFVPGRGVIAYANGREGVLLVGESMEGWQLTRVFADRAEFKNGRRNHYLTAD